MNEWFVTFVLVNEDKGKMPAIEFHIGQTSIFRQDKSENNPLR